MTRVSIVVTNHNYERWVCSAIDSALAQTHDDVEVVVVDDGSTDGSWQACRPYRDRVRLVRTPNRGQAAAVNTGFAHTSGQVVVFLDADDLLAPDAAAGAAQALDRPGRSKASWAMQVIDADGTRLPRCVPGDALPSGDLAHLLLTRGPDAYVSPPMSGNAWSRSFLEQVLPVPEDDFRICADAYLIALAPLHGEVVAVDHALGCYRVHPQSNFSSLSLEARVRLDLAVDEAQRRSMVSAATRLGLDIDPSGWPLRPFLLRLDQALTQLQDIVPAGERCAVVDDDHWGLHRGVGRRTLPFPERDGVWWGRPADDAEAIAETERLRGRGLRHLAVGWPAFWWLEHYPAWHQHLRAVSDEVVESDVLVAFRFEA